MNRHERRRAKALSRLGHKNHGPTVVAVHEAGHAVAKVLAIGELGYSISVDLMANSWSIIVTSVAAILERGKIAPSQPESPEAGDFPGALSTA